MQRVSRKRGLDVWQFRWSDTAHNGRRFHRKKVVGNPDENAARRAVAGLISEINIDCGLTNSNVTICRSKLMT
jgi:hypothetical protein